RTLQQESTTTWTRTKVILTRGNGHPQLRHHALRILRKSPLPLQTEMDRRGYLEAMGSVSRSCCRTPCIQGGSSVVQRNVRQAIPRLCLWNPRPQEMNRLLSLREWRLILLIGHCSSASCMSSVM